MSDLLRGRAPRGWALLGFALLAGLGGATVASGGAAAATSCPSYNPPNTMTLVAGDQQTAKLGTPFTETLQVSVSSSNGCPVTTGLAGIPVTFSAPASGPSGTFASSGTNAALVGTNSSGLAAAPQFTANRLVGGFTLVASSYLGMVGFSLVNTASGVPARITPVTASESATVGTRYPEPLQATVLDANGNPVAGVPVTFTLGTSGSSAGGEGGASTASAGASFAGGGTQATETTDSSGTAASPSVTANGTAGKFTASASTAGVVEPASFSLDNLAGKPPTIVAVGKTKRSTTVGTRYPAPLRAKVRNGNGKPLQGATVTFTLGSGGAGASAGSTSAAGASFVGGSAQMTETTNAAGIAVSPRLTANTTAGTFAVTATTTGTTAAASFRLHNLPGKPAAVTAGAAANESTPVGKPFPIRLAVTATDKNDNPVPGVTVTFTVPARGPSARFHGHKRTVKVRTDAKGIAVAPALVATSTQGGYVVRATAGRHSTAFALVNEPPE